MLTEAIVRYRARIFLPDDIYSRSHKSNRTVIAIFSCSSSSRDSNVISAQWKSILNIFRALQSCASEGGVAPSPSLKLLVGHLHTGFCSHLSTKNQYNKPCKQPDLARITQHSILKCGHVALYAIKTYR